MRISLEGGSGGGEGGGGGDLFRMDKKKWVVGKSLITHRLVCGMLAARAMTMWHRCFLLCTSSFGC